MFESVLIANRGEIACRIIRTCRTLGVRTVAVYSDADKDALHVQMADQAVRIGEAEASDSYLRHDRLVSAARKAKADAVHPGYGFLSENPTFVEEVEKAGLAFIGPSAGVIRQMGDKVQARRLARSANVPVIPGTDGEIDDADAMLEAQRIGYPLMVKAADGGGGMGIRAVRSEADLAGALERARAQAKGAFGSTRVYLERLIENASHVEVQVLADHHGNAVHLFERDCSIQRRNQKVIEETPCPKLTPEARKSLLEASVRLVKTIGYTNAGTIEYLLSPQGDFYFLEMNTRLQVEHPVTEMVTGVDLVELQLRVAAGEKLPVKQSALRSKGAAIEARIYPEDPETLLPTYGVVERLEEPAGDGVRVDSALFDGYEVSAYYEPLMAKLIVWADDRAAAIAKMRAALGALRTEGVVNNTPLVSRVLATSTFGEAQHHNAFLEELLRQPHSTVGGKELIATIALAMALAQERAETRAPSRWRMYGRRAAMVARLGSGAA